jgi:hypothetical protein
MMPIGFHIGSLVFFFFSFFSKFYGGSQAPKHSTEKCLLNMDLANVFATPTPP